MDDEPEIVEGELIELRSYELERSRRIAPAVQTAAAAAGGFLAGAATVALAHRFGGRRVSQQLRRLPQPQAFRPSGTYLVTVRVINRPPL
jgi:hypothetical protein